MPFEVKCAYRVILDLIYMQAGNLPDDPRHLSGLLGCSVRKWKAVRETLIQAGKLVVIGEFLTNYRALRRSKLSRNFKINNVKTEAGLTKSRR